MELQPPTAPLDDFFAPVRRRHPDVDLVVLPPEPPPPPRAVAADDAAERAGERVGAVTELVWSASRLEGEAPGTRFAYGPDAGTVVARSRVSVRVDGCPLDGLRTRLEREGWRPRRIEGPLARLTGNRGDVRVRASYAAETGALVLEVSSEPLLVGVLRARELVRS
jgi:hypothetical protein